MTIEATLKVEYNRKSYKLMVKMIRIPPANYFFIRDMNNEHPLLSGITLELSYKDTFSLTEFGGIVKSPGIPDEIVDAVQKAILKDRQTWLLDLKV
jgi:hypothetical protein